MKPHTCPCNSGLAADRCCQLDPASLPPVMDPAALATRAEHALRAMEAGDTAQAELAALEVLAQAPLLPGALAVLYRVRRQAGQNGAAEMLARRMVAVDANHFWATAELTFLLLAKGALVEAELHARNCVRLAPDSAQAHNLMGMVLTEANRPAVGEFHFRRALELAGARDAVVLANLGLCLKNQGKMAAARAAYNESLALAPRVLHTLLGFARLEEADRNLDAAMELLDRAEELAPGAANITLVRAVVLGRLRRAPEAVALLDQLAPDTAVLGPGELLEKGRLLDQMGEYAAAFAAFNDGKNRLRANSGLTYLHEHADRVAARLRHFFVAKRLRTLPRARLRQDVAQPVFILGFPRSGTTLVEQTLTAHPRITAGDELPMVADITQLMPRMLDSPLSYPDALAELWMGDHAEDLDSLRDYYLRRAAQLGIDLSAAPYFTDKMPLNEMNLGLIAMLFPQSPLIHVVRHPLDVVLSVFSNMLTHGFYCAYALESAARHYVLVMDLVDHYRREMALRYLRIRYEDMVDNQEASVRQLLEFIGEPFDPRCLAFHENRRYARTASYAQVSERLYDRSRFRYVHYLDQLRPVMPILQPVIARLGYSV